MGVVDCEIRGCENALEIENRVWASTLASFSVGLLLFLRPQIERAVTCDPVSRRSFYSRMDFLKSIVESSGYSGIGSSKV
jgi:hypothetical protein